MLGLLTLLSLTATEAALPPTLRQTGYDPAHPKNLLYEPQYPLWSDGGLKRRWLFVPEGKKIEVGPDLQWTFPVGTKLWKEFSLPRDPEDPASSARVETRFLRKQASDTWEMGTYLWNAQQTEAKLAPEQGVVAYWPLPRGQRYDIPSRAMCTFCHQGGSDQVLGVNALQLSSLANKPLTVSRLIELGKIRLEREDPEWIPFDPTIPAMQKVFGQFEANCAHCHSPTGAASFTGLHLQHKNREPDFAKQPAFVSTVNRRTRYYRIPGVETYQLLPGHPEQSAILHRAKQEGLDRMPPVWSSRLPNLELIEALEEWIR